MIQIDAQKHTPSKIIGILIVLLIVLTAAGAVKFFVDYYASTGAVQKQQLHENVLSAYESGDLDAAIAAGQQLVDMYPDDAAGYIALANAFVQRGSVEFNEEENADAAIRLLTKAVSLDRQNAEAYRLLGYAYEIKEEYPRALENYQLALSVDPQNADVLTSRGHMYELTGDYAKAEADYDAALVLDPANSLALLNLASIYIATGRTAEFDVELMLSQAFKYTSDSRIAAEIYNMIGTLHAQAGDSQKARSAFHESLLYDSRLTASWMGRAFADLELLAGVTDDAMFGTIMGDITEAIDSALFLNENQTTAYMLQGILAGTYGADPAAETALYEHALSIIDADITLDHDRKEEMRARIQSLIAEVEADDPELEAIRAEIISDVNAQ